MPGPGTLQNREQLHTLNHPAPSATARGMEYVIGIGYRWGYGTTPPTDGTSGWAPGARFYKWDGSTAGSSAVYVNVGSSTSCNFDVHAL